MKFKIVSMLLAAGVIFVVAACSSLPSGSQAYWQRVEDGSALYMTGLKAQQQLEENIASCVREVDELVELDALRKTLPPDTHSEYHRALKQSGDLAYYDTPTRLGDKKVAHTDFHDFESCMRSKGWERVKVMRYQTIQKSRNTYKEVRQYRDTGLIGDAAVAKQQQVINQSKIDYAALNQ